ncbi:hypothetical protein EON83_26320 [bacterium]|nr:MAG: hypothetical protein EON83_26320 [bacterium]
MPVTIRIFGRIATVKNYQWHCEAPTILEFLNSTLHPHGPSGADPDPDYTAAQRAIALYGHGEIIEHIVIERSEPTPGSSSD